ncbi:NmrA family NAD(P)-binding protein [Actinotalea sp. AC32]|nr:NmrA family NAD(P)-binding protein [Actinotalea sp. AC32]
MTTTHAPQTITVLGGTGHTGRRVAARLAGAGHLVRIGSRAGSPRFDWHDPATYDALLDGADAAYLAYSPDLAMPGAAEELGAVAARAAALGVRRLVLLSGRGEEGARVSEQAVRDADVPLTVLRCAWFAQNFSEHFLVEPVRAGVLALPAGTVREPFVDLEDVADVAVRALTAPGHEGRTYELTGPGLLTFGDVADQISAATGLEVRYEAVTPDEFVALAASDMPVELAEAFAELFSSILDGRNESTTADVEQVLGRPATPFAAYVARTAGTGAWTAVRV